MPRTLGTAHGLGGDGEWRTNPQLDAHVRQEMTALLGRKSELTASAAAAERALRARPFLHPEMGKLYRDWVIEPATGCAIQRVEWMR